jgi:molybdopterin-biosynthesis enzyme MoeA-like protein
LKPFIVPRLTDEGKGICRVIISTPMAESAVAEYLSQLAAEVEARGVKVGSYPRWGGQNNTVTLVGRDKEFLESLVKEVEDKVQGKRIFSDKASDTKGSSKADVS